jgi:hypothetical protein
MAATPSGRGYWLVASDGGVFTFGDAGFYGSGAGRAIPPVVGIAVSSNGAGYWLLAQGGLAPGGVWVPGTEPIEWQWEIDHPLNLSSPADMGIGATTYAGAPAANPTVYDIDMFMNPASTIAALHQAGDKVICYMDAGAYESYRPDASLFPRSVIGNSTGWPGEYWLDIRQVSVLAPIISARMDLAVQKGCDAVEADEDNGWENNSGFPLTKADGQAWDLWVASAAHSRGLSAGFKNQIEIAGWASQYYDWTLNEQCNQYSECAGYPPDGGINAFRAAGKAVFQVEYQGNPGTFCPADNAAEYNGMLMPLSLNGGRTPCR